MARMVFLSESPPTVTTTSMVKDVATRMVVEGHATHPLIGCR